MTWTSLGTVTPATLGPWYPFPQSFAGTGRPTVLIACTNVRPSDRFRSWAWFRTKLTIPGAAEPIYTPAFRIYPTTDPQVRELSIPSPLRKIADVVLRPEIKKLIGYKGLSGTTNENPWGVALSQWEAVAAPPSALSVSWRVEDYDITGYNAEVIIYNAGSEPIENWAIAFDATGDVTNTWGAELDALGANSWQVSPSLTSGPPVIYPGETRVIGLVMEGQPSLSNLRVVGASAGNWDDAPSDPLFFDFGEY